MMQSQRAYPCLITLIKHPVRENNLAPHNPLCTLLIPHHLLISLPAGGSASLRLTRLPADPVQVAPGCISWLIGRHVRSMCFRLRHQFHPNLQCFLTCSLLWRSCQRLPPYLTWFMPDKEKSVLAKPGVSLNRHNEEHALLAEPSNLSLLLLCVNVDLFDSVNRKAMHFPLHRNTFTLSESYLGVECLAHSRFWFTCLWWRLCLRHKAEIVTLNAPRALRQQSCTHKLGRKSDAIRQAAVTYYYCPQPMMTIHVAPNRSERCNMHSIHANASNMCQKYLRQWAESSYL